MQIRMIKPEENVARNLLGDICFAGKAGDDYEEHLKNPLEHSEGYEQCLGGFDKDGNIVAALNMVPFEMNFDGHIVKMCGIEGVVTAPEARGTGVMGKVYEECLRIMKEQGYIFSILIPFSFVYYRKFGYEHAYELRGAKVPIESFRNYPFPKDSVRFWKKGDSTDDLKAIYDEFIKGRNYAINRNDKSWEEILKDADPYTKRRYTYIHYDSEGKADCYLIFNAKRVESDHRSQLHISELAWTTREGLFDMFGFIGGLSPQFGTVFWDVPDDVDLGSMFPECRDVKTELRPIIMTRIVNLPEALKRMRVPAGQNGKVVLEVSDKSMPCNSGKYTITWENGKLTIGKAEAAPDMTTSIETLVQLMVGYLTAEMAIYRKDTTIHGNQEALAALFPKKKLYIWERI